MALGILCAGMITGAQAAPGDLDTSFGSDGQLTTQFENTTTTFGRRMTPDAMVIQPDGKMIAVGHTIVADNGGTYAFGLVRYNTDGSLDTSFGDGGRVITRLANQDYPGAVALQADGKIVVAGFANVADAGGLNFAFALARYNANGTLDTTFDGDGKVVTDLTTSFDELSGVVVQPDGKIVASGFVNTGLTTDFALIRYNANGTIDTGFGNGGIVLTDFFNDYDGGQELALLPSGKIVVAGSASNASTADDFALVRYNADGTLDSSFGVGGKVTTNFSGVSNDRIADMKVAPDQKLVVVGATGQAGAWDFAVARYNPNGSLDTTFDGDGKFSNDFAGNGKIDTAQGVALQQNGKIIVAGDAPPDPSGNYGADFALLRLNPEGSIDSSFGRNGKVLTDFGKFRFPVAPTNDEGLDVEVQADGKIIMVGDIELIGNHIHDLGVARYQGDPVTPQTSKGGFDFDGDGRADVSVFRPDAGVWSMLGSRDRGFTATQFGLSTDKIVPADYDGDGKTDVAVYRDGSWYWLRSSDGDFRAAQFGTVSDIPLPADYDGDGRAELAVYRAGTWFTMNLLTNQVQAVQFGASADVPVPADYDGDGRVDFAVYRGGTWYLLRSTEGFTAVQFGLASDRPVVGDYDGDKRADEAVYRNGMWYLLGSQSGFTSAQFGLASDIPVAADYDGDGRTDMSVYRDGTWYLSQTTAGFAAVQFGIATDKPVPAAFIR